MARPLAGRRSAAAALPEWIPPQLTQLVDAAPEGDQWLHEIKFDGYRMHARVDRGNVRLLTRTGLDWTHKYAAVAAAVASLGNDCLEPLPAVIRDIAWKDWPPPASRRSWLPPRSPARWSASFGRSPASPNQLSIDRPGNVYPQHPG